MGMLLSFRRVEIIHSSVEQLTIIVAKRISEMYGGLSFYLFISTIPSLIIYTFVYKQDLHDRNKKDCHIVSGYVYVRIMIITQYHYAPCWASNDSPCVCVAL